MRVLIKNPKKKYPIITAVDGGKWAVLGRNKANYAPSVFYRLRDVNSIGLNDIYSNRLFARS